MNAKPKRWTYLDNEPVKVHSGSEKGTLWVECEIVHPPSSEGKTVHVFLSGHDVTSLLLELRRSAIEARK